MANEYEGKLGTLYVEKSALEYEVWFEDFHIIGTGATEVAALKDVLRFADLLREQAADAVLKCVTTATQITEIQK